MNRDLFLAILSMDSYNRGYGEGISNLNVNYNTTTLGSATLIADRGDSEAQTAGFYAIAYDWNGETIISYRGTDDPLWLDGDLLNGWITRISPFAKQAWASFTIVTLLIDMEFPLLAARHVD